ncbi:MAG: hypothetical protein D3926_22550 [Desulfobacteraceae bacterium]|mgnify:CR=1 FL=1|nr:MAG: hypothetical protein D3926_22550 [Desulfobacteraceae bacterium]
MIIETSTGQRIDTSCDLTSEERHILQKLMAWESLVDSLTQFREIRKRALQTGWNNSGPVRESRTMSVIIQDMEKKIQARLSSGLTR